MIELVGGKLVVPSHGVIVTLGHQVSKLELEINADEGGFSGVEEVVVNVGQELGGQVDLAGAENGPHLGVA